MERLEPLGCVSPCVLDDSSAVSRSTSCQPPNGRQQRWISHKHVDKCLSEVIFHICSAHRKKFWNSSSVSPTFLGTCSQLLWDSHRAGALDVLAGGGRGYDHETCSINIALNSPTRVTTCARDLETHSHPNNESGNWLPSRETLEEKLETLKRAENSGSKRAIMSTHVGDCRMDGNKTLRNGLMGQLTSAF